MAAEANLTEKFVKAQSIDFVETFGKQIKDLMTMLAIERKIAMPIGTTIKTYKTKVTLDGTKVAKGDIIPLSKVEFTEGDPIELAFEKKRKAVAIEDIQKYGYEQAIVRTDDALLKELQRGIRKSFFDQLGKGTGAATGAGLQSALAQAWGSVQTVFEDDAVKTIAFVNPADIADYLAKAQITLQTAFGLTYVENFLGVSVVVISTLVPKKTIYATAAENLVLAYAPASSGEVSRAFDFTTDETGLIGITRDTDKTRLTAETTTYSATVLFAERLNGVIKVTISAPTGPAA